MPKNADIAVIAAHADGRVLPETYDLAVFAGELGAYCKGKIEIIVLDHDAGGHDVETPAEVIARQTGLDVRSVSCPGLSAYSSDAYRHILADVLKNAGFSYICAPHNSQGMDYGPALAAALDASCITGVDGLSFTEGRLCFQKDIYGGKVKASMVSNRDVTVLTVQPGAFRPDTGKSVAGRTLPGRVIRSPAEYASSRTRVLGVRKVQTDSTGIIEARVVVTAGRGVGDKANMGLIHRLADIFPKSAVAGTRIVCDQGWLAYNRQVGVTGAVVAPELYVACGVSGASQHVMGMRGSKFVVAINTDRHAAMFNESDVCIVADITVFIPLLLEVHQQRENGNTVPPAPQNEESGG